VKQILQEGNPMKISETFSGSYFNAADFPTPRTLVIESVTKVTFPDGSKPAVRLQGERQQLVLNKTNAFVLASAFGDDTECWKGRQIQVVAKPTFYQGNQTQGMSVQPLNQTGAATGQFPAASPLPAPQPQQVPTALTSPPQSSTPQPSTPPVEPSVQAPSVDYDA
jgi:hypothetical protein